MQDAAGAPRRTGREQPVTNHDAITGPADELEIKTRLLEPGITAVTVIGSVGPYTANRLRDRMFELIDGGSVHLVLELDRLEFLDSTGLGTLIGALKKVRRKDGSIQLVGMTERIEKIFRITGLVTVLPPVASVAAAIERIRAPDPQEQPGERAPSPAPEPDAPG